MGEHSCHYCGPTEEELRPYGPGGTNICFPCMTATPEREDAAKGVFLALLDGVAAVSDGAVMIGSEEGPLPYTPANVAKVLEEEDRRNDGR